MFHGRSTLADAGLYAASAVVAGIIALAAGIPMFREWGRLAAPAYSAGAIVALWLAVRRPAGARSGHPLGWLALAVLVGAAILPLGFETVWRARTGPGFHAQSEAIVTEEAARVLRKRVDPYAADYLHGPLETRPLGTKTHFPYLPAMLAFGLPRAFDGSSALADSRIAFAAFTLAVAALAFGRPTFRRASPRDRRMSFLVLAVIPTGALLMATGGDDLPVLALMLLALVLADEGRPGAAGAAAGLAAVTKQTAWILLPLLALAARDREGQPAPGRFSITATAVVAAGVVPFLAWGPADFVEDVIRFPLGLGRQRSAAGTPTLGAALIRLLPSWRVPLTLALVGLVLALFVFIVVRRPPATAWAAAKDAGILFLVAILVAPAARLGYVAYPIDLLVWAWALRAATVSASTCVPPTGVREAGGTFGIGDTLPQ
ncbi:MAG TPA: glycosyltransferase 87 family protein [Actinomycetota bacterium]|nr:glycosyltransferase 87 family protein [Actinomycetota bacterium]